MPRTILAIAALWLALSTASAAADPMSYEGRGYGGPLGVGPNFHSSEPSKPGHYQRKRTYKAKRRTRTGPAEDADTVTAAPAHEAAAKKKAESRNSSIATASAGESKPDEKAATETAAKPASEPQASVGCKRFIASVGETVSVLCE